MHLQPTCWKGILVRTSRCDDDGIVPRDVEFRAKRETQPACVIFVNPVVVLLP